MDGQKLLLSKETIRRFYERALALYESALGKGKIARRYKRTVTNRDISQYQVNEAAPTDNYFRGILANLLALADSRPDTLVRMRRYVDQWTRWLKLGRATIDKFETYVSTHLPAIFSCWMKGSTASNVANCR